MKKPVVHHIRKWSIYFVGYISTCNRIVYGTTARKTWAGVTCKNCLKARTK